MTPPTARQLFVIRMWQEVDAVTATIQWRGSVQHVLSAECQYFTRLADLIAFIAARTEGATVSVPTPQMTEAVTHQS